MNKTQPQGYQLSAFRTLYDKAAEFVDRKIGWYRLPVPLGLAVLGGLRDVLRSRNLYDTSALPAVNLPPVAPPAPDVRTNRTLDGTYNDLSQPQMGMAGSQTSGKKALRLVDTKIYGHGLAYLTYEFAHDAQQASDRVTNLQPSS